MNFGFCLILSDLIRPYLRSGFALFSRFLPTFSLQIRREKCNLTFIIIGG
jgi:hypothetical protein